jgi:hypothetical protein
METRRAQIFTISRQFGDLSLRLRGYAHRMQTASMPRARKTRAVRWAEDGRVVRGVVIALPFSLVAWAMVFFLIYLALV